jgi:Tfp pilus assembly protein FimT
LVAIAVLALIVVPCCSGIVMAFRMNAKADQLMQAQLAVSSAVETLMAEGIPNNTANTPNGEDYGIIDGEDRFDDVTITVKRSDGLGAYYSVTVESVDKEVSVSTNIRAVPTQAETPASSQTEEVGP